jgi:lysophospholipase L1-like esterase
MFSTRCFAAFVALALTACAAPSKVTRFDFRTTAATAYTPAAGYGFTSIEGFKPTPGPLVSDQPFSFIVDLPEGNYDVTVLLGDPKAASDTTVKAESRRLMLESIKTPAGTTVSRTFTVNIRTPVIAGAGRSVSLKDREKGVAHWDDKLSLEFNGSHPALAGLDIKRNDSAVTVYLAGDSTVTDQPGEPWSSWGAMLPRFFASGVAVANHAESGLSLGSFKGGARLDKVLSTLKPGDYVFIQFGHNDMKEKNGGAFTTYAGNLRAYVDAIVAKGGNPVLVTPMYRRRFDGNTLVDTLGDYPFAVRQVAAEKKIPCIDLHAMSARVLTALGPDKSKAAYVHFAVGAYGNDKAVKDDTHFSTYGGYELARCIVEGIREKIPALAAKLAPDAGAYSPDKPADPAAFALPPSPPRAEVRIPDGDGR